MSKFKDKITETRSNEAKDKITSNSKIPEITIGMVGHVDHGKTTLAQMLTGQQITVHSEELKRGITIRLGYADTTFYKCTKCASYGTSAKCSKCFSDAEVSRVVSFLDAPGHETLLATVLSGAFLMDGAVLVIAANEKCPQPQTSEHLKALDISEIKNIIIVQNKIDLVTQERAMKSYNEIKAFVKGTVAENAPIIPVSALNNANIDVLIERIESLFKTPKRDLETSPRFYVARSFDVNRPGTEIEKLKGGILGGALSKGTFKIGDEIEILPGVKRGDKYKPITSKITAIIQGGKPQDKTIPGGLAALQTSLDPALTRADKMAGTIVSAIGKLPKSSEKVLFKPVLFAYIIGIEGQQKVPPIAQNDVLMITAAVQKSVGVVTSISKAGHEITLKIPVVVEKGDKIALAKQFTGRWHLVGYGIIQ